MHQLSSLPIHDVIRTVSGTTFLWAVYQLYPYRHYEHGVPLIRVGVTIAIMAAGFAALSDAGIVEFHVPAFLTFTALLITLKLPSTNSLPDTLIQVGGFGSTCIALMMYSVTCLLTTSLVVTLFWFIVEKVIPEEIHR